MLTVTTSAANVIRSLTDDAGLSGRAGLRLAIDPWHHSLAMALAPRAEPGDLTVFERDAVVFVAAAAAAQLSALTLDADIGGDTRRFYLRD